MSYTANQYNYATPLSGVASLIQQESVVSDKKYFTLFDNKLDGSYSLISGDVGLWGNTLSGTDGTLLNPLIVTVTEPLSVHAFRLISSSDCFPVAFTVDFYNGSDIIYTITETDNNLSEYMHFMRSMLNSTSYVITISKISKANSVARLYNVYNPAYIKRTDTLKTKFIALDDVSQRFELKRHDNLRTIINAHTQIVNNIASADSLTIGIDNVADMCNAINAFDNVNIELDSGTHVQNNVGVASDTLSVACKTGAHILNTINVALDTLSVVGKTAESRVRNTINVTTDTLGTMVLDEAVAYNIHSVMKKAFRRIYGKVYITYTDPMLDSETTISFSDDAHNSRPQQVLDSIEHPEHTFFTLYNNDLSGRYKVIDGDGQVGWVSKDLSNSEGLFDVPPSFTLSFHPRPIVSFAVTFDPTHEALVKDFDVVFNKTDGSSTTLTFRDNMETKVQIIDSTSGAIGDVSSITLQVYRVSRAYSPAVIIDMPLSSTILYKGYEDVSELMSIDLLEELSYEDAIEALGGVSANEVTIKLDNSSKEFFFNSGSIVASQLKRNRKIEPWLGAEITPGVIEWYSLGVFWSHKWDVPANGLTASVVGFDTIGLLSLTPFTEHHVQINKSLGYLIEYILEDAKKSLYFIEYDIDESLYDVVIPYAWFEPTRHAAALRKLSLCYPMHIYCDRRGRICAKSQKLHLDFYYDTWSDSTNVIDKKYSSLYTALPNVINVEVKRPLIKEAEQLVKDDVPMYINTGDVKTFMFNAPYLSDAELSIDCDSTISYSYDIYSWGVSVTFVGSGEVRSVSCTGTCLDVSSSIVVTRRDAIRVLQDGAITRDVKSDFIQTNELASIIIDRIMSLSEHDKYDATVVYRGNIALTINDPILLQDGIAPDNRYNIKRHQLNWNGSLTGSADLNT